MSLLWSFTDKPRHPCGVCGSKVNVCQQGAFEFTCGACLLWAYGILYA